MCIFVCVFLVRHIKRGGKGGACACAFFFFSRVQAVGGTGVPISDDGTHALHPKQKPRLPDFFFISSDFSRKSFPGGGLS